MLIVITDPSSGLKWSITFRYMALYYYPVYYQALRKSNGLNVPGFLYQNFSNKNYFCSKYIIFKEINSFK